MRNPTVCRSIFDSPATELHRCPRTSALVRAYCIQQMFGVVTFPKFDPEEAELGDMQELYDELAHPDIEINPMHYMQRAFFRYGLFPYVDICPQQQPAGPKLSR